MRVVANSASACWEG